MRLKISTLYIANFFTFLVCLVYASHDVLESPSPRSDIPSKRIPNERHEGRVLRAARLKSDLTTRNVAETLRHNHELHYLDESLLGKPTQFAARLRMTSKRPTLVLEEIENLLDEINCDKNRIELGFITSETLELAYGKFTSVDDFVLVTSHEGCNNDGERNAHLVSKVLILEKGRSMVLTVSPMPWKSAFHSLTVDFGGSDADFEVRRHEDLRKRQDTPPTATFSSADSAASTDSSASPTSTAAFSSADSAASTNLSASPTISFTIPPPSSSTPQQSDAHGNVGFQYLDKSILPLDIPGAAAALGLPNGFSVKCKNCTTQGSIHLLQGSFSVDQKNSSNHTENIVQFFSDGYIELQVNNFAAHIELESSVQPSTTLTHYTVQLPEIGLPGFQIPGIAAVGPIFKPSITMGVQLSATFDFVSGFDMTVPNNSSIVINIGNVTESNVTGFPDTKISAIPFQSEVDSASLTFFTSFTPELLLGISVFELGSAGAGVFFDLPSIKATVSQVAHVDSKCNPVTNFSATGNILDDIFGSLTNIVPEVDFDVGLVVQANLDLVPFKAAEEWTALSTTITLPTACLSFDAAAKTYGAAAASKTSSISPSATGTNAATGGIVNPLTRVLHRLGRLERAAEGLALVFGCFLAL